MCHVINLDGCIIMTNDAIIQVSLNFLNILRYQKVHYMIIQVLLGDFNLINVTVISHLPYMKGDKDLYGLDHYS